MSTFHGCKQLCICVRQAHCAGELPDDGGEGCLDSVLADDVEIVCEPPQDPRDIVNYMTNLEAFINNPEVSDLDPLIKMAIIHHQFESIHPFTDGNGRTGRIVNILYLVINNLLDLPILYLSRFITHNKGEYYQLLQAIRDNDGNNGRIGSSSS